MFTGLIEATGSVISVEQRAGTMRIAIEASGVAEKLHTGDSVAVSGVCLTALDIEPPVFQADLAAETVARTSLAHLAQESTVNLELPTPAGAPFGGHVVQGHVDGTGTLLSLRPVDPTADRSIADWWLEVAIPETIRPYMVEKGSIAIEGISLTIARWDGKTATVAILPHTYAATNLHTLMAGSPLNLEADILVKLAVERNRQTTFELTLEYLIANGY
ncbi:MAG: riboflavin synthase [Silvibacterium sp.]|nr:riboflavin synthase [Silvibacterium sp.]